MSDCALRKAGDELKWAHCHATLTFCLTTVQKNVKIRKEVKFFWVTKLNDLKTGS